MPDATVIIITRNRKNIAARAVESALSQYGRPEVLLIDDASEDGTADAMRAAFPAVKVHRSESQLGYIRQRNVAVQMSGAPVVVSLDDDAEFAEPGTVCAAVELIADQNIGAVAIPFINEYQDGRRVLMLPRLPEGPGPWLTNVFVGTAFAVKRDLFLSIGGFQGRFFHWGEETEYALRLINAGYAVALADRGLIIHRPEGVGKYSDAVNRYIPRNRLLTQWINAPARVLVVAFVAEAARALMSGWRSPRYLARQALPGIAMALTTVICVRGLRHPIRWSAYQLFLRLRRHKPVPLAEVVNELRKLRSSCA
jgi:GT2 family glycosyltransferase